MELDQEIDSHTPQADDNPNPVLKLESQAPIADRKRDRRLFGMLAGTLDKFKQDSNAAKTEGAIKRDELVAKLNLKIQLEKSTQANEKEEISKSKMLLAKERKEQKMEQLAALKRKYVMLQEQNLRGILCTSTQPCLFFIPKKHNSATTEMLERQQTLLKEKPTII